MTSCVAIGLLQAVTVNTTASRSTKHYTCVYTVNQQCRMASCSFYTGSKCDFNHTSIFLNDINISSLCNMYNSTLNIKETFHIEILPVFIATLPAVCVPVQACWAVGCVCLKPWMFLNLSPFLGLHLFP